MEKRRNGKKPFSDSHHGGARPRDQRYNSKPSSSRKVDLSQFNTFEKRVCTGINRYKELIERFCEVYDEWKGERLNTIKNLQKLADEIHEKQLDYNIANHAFKSFNVASRSCKTDTSLDFFASIATLVTDVASGITSIAQAINVDEYTKQFNALMEQDALMSKSIYEARSVCVAEYHGVEEIIRRYHETTFSTTLESISSTLSLEKQWLDIKRSHSNELSQIVQFIDLFINSVANSKALETICDSVSSYVDSNPAVGDACKSAGKALHSVCTLSLHGDKEKKNRVAKIVNGEVNNIIVRDNMNEISRLRNLIDNDQDSQTSIESKIKDAISTLHSESAEMSSVYFAMRQSSNGFVKI